MVYFKENYNFTRFRGEGGLTFSRRAQPFPGGQTFSRGVGGSKC